ncbi:D-alanine--D-alanine ligase [Patescibacteria group bacterium]|nr:D-alanine--D-alanine ligase [Patescibacteria group bacterium]
MHKVRVGVLRGGPSSQYNISLQTGDNVLHNLNREKYTPYDILITLDGTWHLHGKETLPETVFSVVDVMFNALHGTYGEDGKVQSLLDTFSVPYTGSQALPSATGMNKVLTKQALVQLDIKMPQHLVIETPDNIEERAFDIFRNFPQPTVIKPVIGGLSVGVTLAKTPDEIAEGVRFAFEYAQQVLVEEYIGGKEATCGVVEQFRGEVLYKLLPVEIIPQKETGFFDYNAKYNGLHEEHCPGNFTFDEKKELERIAGLVHTTLGLYGYSRSDFIVSRRGIYFLETNTLPALTKIASVPKALETAGCSFPEFLDHIIGLAMARK